MILPQNEIIGRGHRTDVISGQDSQKRWRLHIEYRKGSQPGIGNFVLSVVPASMLRHPFKILTQSFQHLLKLQSLPNLAILLSGSMSHLPILPPRLYHGAILRIAVSQHLHLTFALARLFKTNMIRADDDVRPLNHTGFLRIEYRQAISNRAARRARMHE